MKVYPTCRKLQSDQIIWFSSQAAVPCEKKHTQLQLKTHINADQILLRLLRFCR